MIGPGEAGLCADMIGPAEASLYVDVTGPADAARGVCIFAKRS
jgi:hypothetical protein